MVASVELDKGGKRKRVDAEGQLKLVRDFVKMDEDKNAWCKKHGRTNQQLDKWCAKHLDQARSLENHGTPIFDNVKMSNGAATSTALITDAEVINDLTRQNTALKAENDRYLRIIGKFAADSIE